FRSRSTMFSMSDAPRPLTQLDEEQLLFRDAVLGFARERIAPLVHDMDATATLDRSLLPELFRLGVMGIEIPEEYGGAGSSFFNAILAVEALATVDASVSVLGTGHLAFRKGTHRSTSSQCSPRCVIDDARGRRCAIASSPLRTVRDRARSITPSGATQTPSPSSHSVTENSTQLPSSQEIRTVYSSAHETVQ